MTVRTTMLDRLKFACVILLATFALPFSPGVAQTPPRAANEEVFYHIFNRSFRDSDGDRNGDLQGIIASLDYLQDLGVTSILLTPLYPSHFYHNYFASDFHGVDGEYGSMEDYRRLVAEVHRRGMKIHLDQEMQYVAHDHVWWAQPRANRASRYSDYILWDDREKGIAEEGPFGLREATGFDGRTTGITTVNLHSPAVQAYFERYFLSWVDPNGDGDFTDGVDGFRIDHMMDDLDGKGLLTDLFARFWRPLFARLRAANPNLRMIAEQADWGYGDDYLTRGGVDCVFAFPLRSAIASLDKARLVEALAQTERRTPAGGCQLTFVENHDMNRFASEVDGAPAKLELAAALTTLLRGTPILYYGQEIGMRGRAAQTYGIDANHIPLREAFRWKAALDAPGSALWYRSERPWWRARFNRDGDGVSVEEQARDPDSLLNLYRRLLRLRRERPELSIGDQRVAPTEGPVFAAMRVHEGGRTLLIANLSSEPARASLDAASLDIGSVRDLLGGGSGRVADGRLTAELGPYEFAVLAAP